jgi:hypothetical protein
MSKTITRRILRGFAVRNHIEQKTLSMDEELAKIARQLRTRLVNENPDMSDADIDAKVFRIMQHGSQPTSAAKPPPMEIPKEVRDARRAARREQKRRLRPHRRK